jgi:hypothetical protein
MQRPARPSVSAIAALLLIFWLGLATSTRSQNADQARSPRVLIETLSAKLSNGNRLSIAIDGVLGGEDLYDDPKIEIRDDLQTLQRIDLFELLNTAPKRGALIAKISDIDRDGSDERWVVIDTATQNTTMRLFRFSPRLKRYVADRDFTNPIVDSTSGCIIDHVSGGSAGWRGKMTVFCRSTGRWVKRFHRTQSESKSRNGSYTATQTDYSTTPPRTQSFHLIDDQHRWGPWYQRLPAWVRQMKSQALQAEQRARTK